MIKITGPKKVGKLNKKDVCVVLRDGDKIHQIDTKKYDDLIKDNSTETEKFYLLPSMTYIDIINEMKRSKEEQEEMDLEQ